MNTDIIEALKCGKIILWEYDFDNTVNSPEIEACILGQSKESTIMAFITMKSDILLRLITETKKIGIYG